jgi:DNA-directed RNA polymerase specialized sigma24 family protein
MRINDAVINDFLHTAYPRLVAAVALVCSSRPAAEDAVQEALLRAWERSEKGDEIDYLNAWVTTVALNLARSSLRRGIAERRAGAVSPQRPASVQGRAVTGSTWSAPWRRSPADSARRWSSATTCRWTRGRSRKFSGLPREP